METIQALFPALSQSSYTNMAGMAPTTRDISSRNVKEISYFGIYHVHGFRIAKTNVVEGPLPFSLSIE